MRLIWPTIALMACAGVARSQPHPGEARPQSKPIQDNSFLLEESYNQEESVVQHINLFQRDLRTGEWVATFTQEYPVGGVTHQLSYTVPYQRLESNTGTSTGLGDLAINYRYQLVGNAEARIASAPRLTIFLPTGNSRKGLGEGAVGVQVGFPVSVVLGRDWIAHGNAGATFTPSARNERGERADAFAGYLGGSVIWLGGGRFNLMLETLWSRFQNVEGPGRTRSKSSLLVSPGIRWAYDFASGLQIVPGVGVPIGLGPSGGKTAVLLYLSFEHPFQARATGR